MAIVTVDGATSTREANRVLAFQPTPGVSRLSRPRQQMQPMVKEAPMIGKWRSKKFPELVVDVTREEEKHVWYTMPEYSTLQCTLKDAFLALMERIEDGKEN